MKKFFGLLALLMAVFVVPAFADGPNGIVVKGDQVSWQDLKPGDVFMLQNATGTWNMAYANCKFEDLSNVFLGGTSDKFNRGNGTQLDVTATPLSSDNFFTLVEAPAQKALTPDGVVEVTSYYLQHVDSKKYVKGTPEGNGADCITELVEDIKEATSFQVVSAWAIPQLINSKVDYPVDENGNVTYYKHDQWTATGLVNNMSGAFLHWVENEDGSFITFKFGPFWNYGYSYYGSAGQDISTWNFYKVAYDESALAKLDALVGMITAEKRVYTIGTEPGYYAEDKVAAYELALVNAQDFLYGSETGDDAKAQQLYEALETAFNEVEASLIGVTDGYYAFINAFPNYENYQHELKAMTVNVKGHLAWGKYSESDPSVIFKVTSLGDGTYSIQNVASGRYIADGGQLSAKVLMTDAQEVPQVFNIIAGSSQWNITNTGSGIAYHTEGHLDGNGLSGDIVNWDGGANGASAWVVKPITDEAIIAAAIQNGPAKLLGNKLQTYLDTANQVLPKVYDYVKLITNGAQITSNAKTQNNNVLIDGVHSYASEFESQWSTQFADPTYEGIGYHNLQIALNEPIDKLFFEYWGRPAPSAYHDNPNNIGVYVTNDDALGASTAAADSTEWLHVCDLVDGFPANVSDAHYVSPTLNFGEPYKYVRLVVRSTTNMHVNRNFANPFKSGVTFNICELQLYAANATENSEYNAVPGMKEAVDNMNALMKISASKIANNTATQADIDALAAAIKAVNDLYVDREALDAQLAQVLADANGLYNAALGSREVLVTDASQFSANSQSISDHGTFEHLIDGETQYQNNFHSIWVAEAMQNPNITAEEWEQTLTNLDPANFKFTGIGYHNLQVKLNTPVNNFWFEYIGRTGTAVVDNPTDIEIFATNDDELGASTDQAEIDQWTRITELTEGMPDRTAGAKYVSPVIELGDSYKYIRFVIKNTAMFGQEAYRQFLNPEITGITWNVGEWQLFQGLDPHRIQYNYNPDVKAAVDAMKVLIDAAEAIEPLHMLDDSKIVELQNAVDLARSLFADTTKMAELYKFYNEIAANAEEGEGVGYVDSQEAIDAFAQALKDGKSLVDPVQPYQSQIKEAIAKFSEAYDALAAHVTFPAANTWYTIVAGSVREYAIDQPIFLGSLNTGASLNMGTYPIATTAPETDPYAVWRLVPVEGEDHQFAIQSLGTGQYWGAYKGGIGAGSIVTAHTPDTFKVVYYGQGGFRLQPAAVTDAPYTSLKADQSTQTAFIWTSATDHQQCWKFVPAESDILTINWFPASTTQIMTLPFATGGDISIVELNSGAQTYGVHSLTSSDEGTTLGLVAKTDFEAGEPFIIVTGESEADNGQFPIVLATPEDVTDTSAVVANGLVGTLQGMSIATPGMGIFVNSALTATTGRVDISGRSGYLDPTKVVNGEGAADLEISTGDIINAVKNAIAVKGAANSNVYTIDGKLVKRNAKAADALKGLNKGIYIIGKKKVSVK